VNRAYEELGHLHDIRDRENLGGIISRLGTGNDLIPGFGLQEGFDRIMLPLEASQDGGSGFDDPTGIGEITGAFEWVEIIHDELQKRHVARGGEFVFCATSNSNIMTSLAQRPCGYHMQIPR
jgi:hypothetical protein